MKRRANHFSALTETSAGSGIYTNENYSVWVQQVYGYPNYKTCLVITDGFSLSNTFFTVWETAPLSNEYRNHNEPIPTDLDPDDLKMGDFTAWQLKIGGVTDTSLVTQVSITTSVDSTNKITFSAVKGSLVSDQKFILIPDGPLEAAPPAGYVPIRSDVETPGTRTLAANIVAANVTLKGGEQLEKEKERVKDAIVWRSLKGSGNEKKIVALLESMKYNVEISDNATKQWVLDRIKKKEIWYSMCHAGAVPLNPKDRYGLVKFEGLALAKKGEIIRQSDIAGLELDYKLVIVDACCSAMLEHTRLDSFEVNNYVDIVRTIAGMPDQVSFEKKRDARQYSELVPECQAFANAFGKKVAYMGWAWTMNPIVAQPWTSEFLDNLKDGYTVQEAYDDFLSAHGATNPTFSDKNQRMMKIYGKKGNVIDKTPQ